nr:MAG TPA: hypothetical protein [Caudoviricetes sp.]
MSSYSTGGPDLPSCSKMVKGMVPSSYRATH